jgi:two-component system, chemotaxis family, sensor kinase CheA
MDPAKYAEIYVEESREHLNAINQQLLDWERQPEASEPVDAIFRAVHNIEGMSATMGYASVATLAHRVENLLDLVRRRGDPATSEVLDLLFRSTDVMEQAVEMVVKTGDGAVDVSDLVSELDTVATGYEPKTRRAPADRPSVPMLAAPVLGGRGVRISLNPAAPLKGARAILILNRLKSLGNVFGVQPPPAVLETDNFDGVLGLRIDSEATDEAIEREIRAGGDVEAVEIGDLAPDTKEEESTTRSRHVRVDLRRLDTLMNSIGELAAARGRLEELSTLRADPELEDLVVRISHLSQELQSEIIQARMAPGWQLFDRFPRLVRDVARKLGKKVRLEVEGKEIELDRTILDELGDPLMHLLRNAIDHGIETPKDRAAAGKPVEGRVLLSASRERSAVVIRVADDGKGIDLEAVRADAAARGIEIGGTEGGGPRNDQVLQILARPGFSTAQSVSDVSGRGVGIDAVINRLRAFGGSIDLTSAPGQGTAFTLRLPPTLAIVPALLAEVSDELYALPLTHVEETIDLEDRMVTEMEGMETIVMRDRVIPLVRLRRLVAMEDTRAPSHPAIILQIGERRSGLVVDRVAGQREIVVKSFDAPIGTAPIFSGATILGDGQTVLILDAARLV